MFASRVTGPRPCLALRKARLSVLYSTSIHERDAAVNAFAYITDDVPDVGEGPLSGMNIAVKDNICTKTMPTTCSSAMLREFSPPINATVVQSLADSGARILGKTNCDEFGMGSLNIHSIHGAVINPFKPPAGATGDQLRSAGGSSGGSAAAVAAGFCDAALGTDTGGSIRLPASYCGVVGMKPSYGMLSRWGVVSFADSLDCVGVIGKDVSSTKRVYDRLAVYDPKDPTCARPETRERAKQRCSAYMASWASPSEDLTGLRIGIPQEYFPDALSQTILTPFRRLVRSLKSRGASIINVSLPNTAYALSAYYVISSAEASSNLARYDGVQYGSRVNVSPNVTDAGHTTALTYTRTRTAGFGQEVKRRLLLGTYALTADAFDNYFLQAQRVRRLVHKDFASVFVVPDPLSDSPSTTSSNVDGVHVLLHPSAIQTAPPLPDHGSKASESGDSLDVYMQDVLTVPASLAGVPAMSVPLSVGRNARNAHIDAVGMWPIGASLVGQWGCEDMVLRVAQAVEDLESE